MILNLKPISGSLQPRKGMLHVVVNLNLDGKRKQPWIHTGLTQRNGKTKAKQFLIEELSKINEARDVIIEQLINSGIRNKDEIIQIAEQKIFELVHHASNEDRCEFEVKLNKLKQEVVQPTEEKIQNDILFLDYLRNWLPTKFRGKKPISENTYDGYVRIIEGRIAAFFSANPYTVSQLTSDIFEEYYEWLYDEGLKNCTALHHHRLMYQAVRAGAKKGFFKYNIMDQVEAPPDSDFIASYYSEDEAIALFKLAKEKNDLLYIPILLATYYGLRRSEVLGLRWSAIDFKNGKINIERKIITVGPSGKREIKDTNQMKTFKSRRTLPLIPFVAEELKQLKADQEECKQLFSGSKQYIGNVEGYICTNPVTGELITPSFVTKHFLYFLRKNAQRVIRFHDLRHTCASLLVLAGFTIYQVAVWLGHSTSITTEKFYAHLDFRSHLELAKEIGKILSFEKENVIQEIAQAIHDENDEKLTSMFKVLSMENRNKLIEILQNVMAA